MPAIIVTSVTNSSFRLLETLITMAIKTNIIEAGCTGPYKYPNTGAPKTEIIPLVNNPINIGEDVIIKTL